MPVWENEIAPAIKSGKKILIAAHGNTLPALVKHLDGISEEEMDNYAIQLAEYLDQKEALVYQLQSRLVEFQQQLAKEQALSQRITTLTQY